MNAAGVTGVILIVVGVVCLRHSWRKYNSMNDLVLLDIERINLEKPRADLDSDQAFVAHKEAATGWLVIVFISTFLTLCSLIITVANLT